jgi:hypothetical protein
VTEASEALSTPKDNQQHDNGDPSSQKEAREKQTNKTDVKL